MNHPMFDKKMRELIHEQIVYVGDNPEREGLIDTPDRVIKSWNHLFSGYDKNPADVFKTFDSEKHDQLVLLKNIEFYSTCEHHLLSFFGHAHVAYIPSDKIVGISKLARLVDIFARRLQNQERLGSQIVDSLMDHLNPVGAACIIHAKHICMMARGVKKQNSVMETISLRGVFLQKDAQGLSARNELMSRIPK